MDNWATPNAHDGRRPGSDEASTQGRNLKREAEQFALGDTAHDHGGGESLERKRELGRNESGGGDLQAQAETLWGTPNSHERTHDPREVDSGVQLANQASGFPTPSCRDYRDPNLTSYGNRGGADEGRAVAELCRAPLTVPGPGAAGEWRRILEEFPWLAPARSRFDWLCDGFRRAGLLPVGLSGEGTHEPVIIRDRRRGRELGRAIGIAIASERAQAKKAVGIQAANNELGRSTEVDANGIPQEVESQIYGIINDTTTILDQRNSSLRACGNAVVVLQGGAALILLLRRAGLVK